MQSSNGEVSVEGEILAVRIFLCLGLGQLLCRAVMDAEDAQICAAVGFGNLHGDGNQVAQTGQGFSGGVANLFGDGQFDKQIVCIAVAGKRLDFIRISRNVGCFFRVCR